MAKIAFYEKERNELERKDFVSSISDKSTKYVHVNPDTELLQFDVLFVHQPDFIDFKQEDNRGNQIIKVIYKVKWIVLFGGKPSNFQRGNESDKIIQYINFNDLKHRFDEIKKDIESLTEITKQKLENIIFAIDPELERLLKPFEKLSPFENVLDKAFDLESNIVKDTNAKELNIKEALNNYVDSLVKTQ